MTIHNQKALLSKQTLNNVSQKLPPISYALNGEQVGIVHLGIGAFHRGHQAVFTDELLRIKSGHWRIDAVSFRSSTIRDQMQPQDCLYTVVECSPESKNIKLIGAINRVLVAPENPQAVIDIIAKRSTQVVTITVTEKGYCRDLSGQHLNVNDPTIIHDLTHPQTPKSLVGFLVAACKIRQQNNDKNLTVISCDNLPANGDLTRTVVLEFANAVDKALADWIEQHVKFCNSMVDRIVPAITEQDVANTANEINLLDNSTIVTEPFKQWIIQNNFAGERPEWDLVGAMFVDDVEPFENMKLRLLNGTHSALAYIGFLLGFDYIHEAINFAPLAKFVTNLQESLIATLDDVEQINLPEYAALIRTRFSNHYVPYKTMQVASDGSQKLPQRLLKAVEQQGKFSEVSLVIAAWFRFLEGETEMGEKFVVVDPLSEKLTAVAKANQDDTAKKVHALMECSGAFSEKLMSNQSFCYDVVKHLTSIQQKGMKNTLLAFNPE